MGSSAAQEKGREAGDKSEKRNRETMEKGEIRRRKREEEERGRKMKKKREPIGGNGYLARLKQCSVLYFSLRPLGGAAAQTRADA